MDSCNSGSLQSSSGGDEEYNSRAAVDSFIITSHVGGLPISPTSFDPISSYIQFSQNLSPLFLNPNVACSGPGPESLRSDPNPSASNEFNNRLLSGSSVFQPPAATVGAVDTPAAQNPPRNPRKRSRASRRAPTTVLTTDTTNFRDMVQEFTGIPAPPFASSSLPRTRFDLFGARSAALDPPYFRRLLAQKPQPPPPPPFPAANNLFNFPNPLLNSLLQSNPKFFPPKPNHHESFEIPSKIDGLDHFGLSSGSHVDPLLTGLPNLISSDRIGAAPKNRDHSDNGVYGFPTEKTDLPASEKGPDNIGGRSEGMVESWICSE